MTTRRAFLWGSCALAVLAKLGFVVNARAQSQVPNAELAQPSPLGDVVLGSPDAPVTIIEYASMTCPHCAQFQAKTFPKLKERYIDTGKVRYIFREFPLDPLAAGAFMLARCADKDKYLSIVDLFFGTQREWVVPNPLQPMFNVAKQAGYNEETFNACLKNQQILDGIQSVRDHAAKVLNVESTPTFFINGKRVIGDVSIEEMEKEIKPFLKA
ncbi:MAG: DsbA family protein [Xanthobacteraceae bacterium]|nr:DsbA family protein [Xanthobacteraceae bacterium]